MAEATDPFDCLIVHREVPTDPRIASLVWWSKRFGEHGFAPASSLSQEGDHASLSCRTPKGLLITARGTNKSRLLPDEMVEVIGLVKAGGRPQIRCRGLLTPPADTLLHLAVYQAQPDVQAILHGHDPATLGKARELNLPTTTRPAITPSLEVIQEVCGLAKQHRYILLRDHGFLVLGPSVDEAGELAQSWSQRVRSRMGGGNG